MYPEGSLTFDIQKILLDSSLQDLQTFLIVLPSGLSPGLGIIEQVFLHHSAHDSLESKNVEYEYGFFRQLRSTGTLGTRLTGVARGHTNPNRRVPRRNRWTHSAAPGRRAFAANA